MHPTLEAIKEAWDKDSGGRDEELARSLSDDFVAENPDLYTDLENMRVSECVNAVDVYRAAGEHEKQWQVEAWLLHHFEPQKIGGPVEAQVRVVS